MDNSLEKKVSIASLIKYTLPTVVMMVFFSFYTIVDGMFISRFVGTNALSATNIIYPVLNLLLGIGIMFATGGSAIVAKRMGQGKEKKAREIFTLITITSLTLGITVAIISGFFIKQIIYALGATDILYNDCYSYLSIMLLFTPVIILKMYFDYFLVTAGAANLGLISSVAGGIINMILDYVFIVPLNMGVSGAALATCIGYTLPSLVGIIYFFKRKNTLHFVKTSFDFKIIKDTCINGSSEMVTQLASAVTTFLYNIAMIKFLGEDGVAAITIILYVQFLLGSAYMGFTSGVAPRISYNYGSKNDDQVKRLVKYSIIIVGVFGFVIFMTARVMETTLISIFAAKGTELFNIALNGFKLFSIGFLISGLNIFISGMFTAFSNGKISAMLSLFRTFIFFVIGMMVLPNILGVNGVWLVVPFAEIITLIISVVCMRKYKDTYIYGSIFKKGKLIEV